MIVFADYIINTDTPKLVQTLYKKCTEHLINKVGLKLGTDRFQCNLTIIFSDMSKVAIDNTQFAHVRFYIPIQDLVDSAKIVCKDKKTIDMMVNEYLRCYIYRIYNTIPKNLSQDEARAMLFRNFTDSTEESRKTLDKILEIARSLEAADALISLSRKNCV